MATSWPGNRPGRGLLIAWLVRAIASVVFLLCLGVNRPLAPPTQMSAIELDS